MSKAVHIDFEYEQFLKELSHEVNALVYADEEGATKEGKFTEYVMETLAEAGETEGVRLCHYEKENRFENVQFKINGYAIEEGFESLDIFITAYRDTHRPWRLSKADFDNLIKWPTSFLNVVFKGYHDEIEPSTEAYGLSRMVHKHQSEFIRVNVFMLSNGNMPHDPPKNFKLKNLEELTFNFHVWDAERLHRLSQSRNNREPIEIDFEDTLGEVIPCLSMPSDNDLYNCYLAIVPGQMLSTLYRNYGTRLLESNVRAFLQQTGKVNKGIRDTIRHEPWMFLPYNNGLATTAQEVKIKLDDRGREVITGVKDFQIVNGGQTTASLFHTEKKFKADLSQVFVQMKLTVIKDEEKKNETVPFISRYANSQNKVSELDLTSNNPFMQRLEELSRTTFAIDPTDPNKQTIWFFERVKGQYREALNKEPTKSKKDAFKLRYPRSQLIIKSGIAKYMNVWNQLPHHVSKGAQKNYNIYLKGIEESFKKKSPNRLYWKHVVANAILYQAADQLFGRKNQNPIGDTNIKSYTIAYTLSLLHYSAKSRINLNALWEKQEVPSELEREIKNGLTFVYDYLKNLDVALISEAAKDLKTWDGLKEKESPFAMDVIQKHLSDYPMEVKMYQKEDEEIVETKRYAGMQRLTNIGVSFWDGLRIFNTRENILSELEEIYIGNIKKRCLSYGSFSEKEIKIGEMILNRLIADGVDLEGIKDLSTLDSDIKVDADVIYNRLAKIPNDDWDRMIKVARKTGVLDSSEINVLEAVWRRLKAKDGIDLKRLQIMERILDKMGKFGFKY